MCRAIRHRRPTWKESTAARSRSSGSGRRSRITRTVSYATPSPWCRSSDLSAAATSTSAGSTKPSRASGQWQHAPVSPTAPPAIVRRSYGEEPAPAANVPQHRMERNAPQQNQRQEQPSRPALVMPAPRSTLQLQQEQSTIATPAARTTTAAGAAARTTTTAAATAGLATATGTTAKTAAASAAASRARGAACAQHSTSGAGTTSAPARRRNSNVVPPVQPPAVLPPAAVPPKVVPPAPAPPESGNRSASHGSQESARTFRPSRHCKHRHRCRQRPPKDMLRRKYRSAKKGASNRGKTLCATARRTAARSGSPRRQDLQPGQRNEER